jgi:hypothetical protein
MSHTREAVGWDRERSSVKDSQGNLVLGRTRWRRFAAVMGAATVVTGGVLFGMANGAVAASFSVSGQSFKVAASHLHGDGFAQFSGFDTMADGTKIPTAASVITDARLNNLCQSVNASASPIVKFLFPGKKIVLRIDAGGDDPATAHNLTIGMSKLTGNATFTKIKIGRDGGEVSGSPQLAGTFAQSAESVEIDNLQQTATSTEAGTFALTGLTLQILVDSNLPNAGECFA